MNVTTTETKLFAIRCGINRALSQKTTNHITVVTDAIYYEMVPKKKNISHTFSNLVCMRDRCGK